MSVSASHKGNFENFETGSVIPDFGPPGSTDFAPLPTSVTAQKATISGPSAHPTLDTTLYAVKRSFSVYAHRKNNSQPTRKRPTLHWPHFV
jgi:hypothetical protein